MVHAKQQGAHKGRCARFHMRSQFCPDQAAEQQFFGQRRKHHRHQKLQRYGRSIYGLPCTVPPVRQREKKLQEHIQDQAGTHASQGCKKTSRSQRSGALCLAGAQPLSCTLRLVCAPAPVCTWYLARPGIPLSDIHLQFFPVCRIQKRQRQKRSTASHKQRILCTK